MKDSWMDTIDSVTINNLIADATAFDMYEQRRFNHVECSAGRDARQRLYVKRVNKGYVAYCHNCGKHGFLTTKSVPWNDIEDWIAGENERVKESGTLTLPDGLLFWEERHLWPEHALDFVVARLKGTQYVNDNPVAYDTDSGMICMINNRNTHMVGYQLRDPKSKRIYTYGNKSFCIDAKDGNTDYCVIVEDFFSAKSLSNLFNVSAVAMCGTHFDYDDDYLKCYVSGHNKVMVYLDNDEAGWKAAPGLVNNMKILTGGLVWNITGACPEFKNCNASQREEIAKAIFNLKKATHGH